MLTWSNFLTLDVKRMYMSFMHNMEASVIKILAFMAK